ncbi:MAG: CxxC-x17-CxxC domain-containing protein [Candidatus Paceibacteria bacterium]|jgi:CxxC-x17-CxxC domain-containing protein
MNNFKGGFKKGGGNFDSKPKFGGGRNEGGRSFGGGGNRGGDKAPQRFQATCATCQKSCEVPFRPSGDKPVYCSECFGKRSKDDSRDDRGGHGRNERPDFSKPPRDNRPPRHDRQQGQVDTGLIDIKRQLTAIESRLNRILDLINPPLPAKKTIPVDNERKVVGKKVDKSALKKVIKKTVKAAAPKKVAKKATTKKAVKKVAKKVTKKVVKKVTKKAVKKVTKKTK